MTDQYDRLASALADRYAVERELGRGGMATVYLARDRKHDRLVAIKVLHPDLAASLGTERFLREIRITAKLNHPHILALYDSGEAGGFLYYVMPFVEGESLATRIAREKQLSIKEAVQITGEVAEALGYAHSYGLVHRDIKPQNILLAGGHAVVADFGIATAVSQAGGEKLTRTGTTIGTPEYMSPEQATGAEQLDGRSDLYSLACVLYEMLVGQVPFTGTTPQQVIARHSLDHVPPPSIMRDTIPEDLEQIILTAMAKVPADRYRTAADMVEALDAVDTSTTVQRVPRTATRPVSRPRRRRRVWMLSGIAAGAVVLAGGAWLLFGARHGRAGSAAAGGLDLKRIAVLYFQPVGSRDDLGPVADGLTEDLIADLARVPGLDVVSVNGVAPWRASDVPRDSIARALGAGTLVLGTVEAAPGQRLRVSTRLVDGASGADAGELASFVVPKAALLSARDSVAQEVSRGLRRWLGQEITLRERRAGTSSPTAWTLLQQAERARQRARDMLSQGDRDGADTAARRADSLLAGARQADGRWIEPLLSLGRVALIRANVAQDVPGRTRLMQEGMADAQRALRQSPGDGRVLELLGTLRYWTLHLGLEPDRARQAALLDSAQADLNAAVRADPTLASAYAMLGRLYYDRSDVVSAVLAARQAYEADAYLQDAPRILSLLSIGSYNIMQFSEARRWCTEGARRFPKDYRFVQCRIWLMTVPGATPDVARAFALAAREDSLAPPPLREYLRSEAGDFIGAMLARSGLRDSANQVWQRARPQDPALASEMIGLEGAMRAIGGDGDGAMALIKRYVAGHPSHSFETGGMLMWWYRDLQQRPDFQALLQARR